MATNQHQAFYSVLGHRIREVRQQKNLTQESLAKRVSLTRTSVTNIEKGRQQLLVHTFLEIAEALSVSPASLLPQSGTPLPDQLDELLKTQSPEAQAWIKSVIDTAEQE